VQERRYACNGIELPRPEEFVRELALIIYYKSPPYAILPGLIRELVNHYIYMRYGLIDTKELEECLSNYVDRVIDYIIDMLRAEDTYIKSIGEILGIKKFRNCYIFSSKKLAEAIEAAGEEFAGQDAFSDEDKLKLFMMRMRSIHRGMSDILHELDKRLRDALGLPQDKHHAVISVSLELYQPLVLVPRITRIALDSSGAIRLVHDRDTLCIGGIKYKLRRGYSYGAKCIIPATKDMKIDAAYLIEVVEKATGAPLTYAIVAPYPCHDSRIGRGGGGSCEEKRCGNVTYCIKDCSVSMSLPMLRKKVAEGSVWFGFPSKPRDFYAAPAFVYNVDGAYLVDVKDWMIKDDRELGVLPPTPSSIYTEEERRFIESAEPIPPGTPLFNKLLKRLLESNKAIRRVEAAPGPGVGDYVAVARILVPQGQGAKLAELIKKGIRTGLVMFTVDGRLLVHRLLLPELARLGAVPVTRVSPGTRGERGVRRRTEKRGDRTAVPA